MPIWSIINIEVEGKSSLDNGKDENENNNENKNLWELHN